MPLLVTPEFDAPLSQGDILRGTVLHLTNSSGVPLERTKPDFLLVLSRNCNSIRDEHVIVSPVVRTTMEFSADNEEYEKLRRELEVYRNGYSRPDRLYLGNIDGQVRYSAHLDEFYMIEIPTGGERSAFVSRARVRTLSSEYLFDLHARIFICFSRRGFDDGDWFCDADLELLVRAGNAKRSRLESELANHRVTLSRAETEESGWNRICAKD